MKALYYDPAKEIIWIGTHLGGLNKLDIRTGTFTHYLMEEGNPETLPSNIVRDIAPYQDQLIVATQTVCACSILRPENVNSSLKIAKKGVK